MMTKGDWQLDFGWLYILNTTYVIIVFYRAKLWPNQILPSLPPDPELISIALTSCVPNLTFLPHFAVCFLANPNYLCTHAAILNTSELLFVCFQCSMSRLLRTKCVILQLRLPWPTSVGKLILRGSWNDTLTKQLVCKMLFVVFLCLCYYGIRAQLTSSELHLCVSAGNFLLGYVTGIPSICIV
jgi:hypothetical protein